MILSPSLVQCDDFSFQCWLELNKLLENLLPKNAISHQQKQLVAIKHEIVTKEKVCLSQTEVMFCFATFLCDVFISVFKLRVYFDN